MTEIMLDLETLDTTNGAAILSIGAVKFNDTEILDQFHVGIDPATCQEHGLSIGAGTFMWWMDPARADARDAVLALERVDLASALWGFHEWATSDDPEPLIWGNGATFDNVILRSAYAACRMEYPTPFWNDKCYRTVKGMAPEVALVRFGLHHSAVDDALSQAKHLQAIREHLRGKDALIAAYVQGATDVHNNHRPDLDPDFTEAAHDYAAGAIA